MKKRLFKIAALIAAISMLGATSFAFAQDAPEEVMAEGEGAGEAGESAEEAGDSEEAESEGAESASEEGESASEAAPAVTEAAGSGMVTVLSAAGHDVLVYYPADNATDLLPLSRSCTAPLFVVFGDGAFDGESVDAYAVETGLAQIAASEGSSIVFVNPLGETWDEADQGVFEAIVDLVDDSSTDAHAYGITESFNFFTQATSQGIMATSGRMYLYGEGSGAQFVADNYIKSLKTSTTFGDGVTIEFDNTITGCTLVGLESIGEIEDNDIPVVAVACSEDVNKTLEEACGVFLAEDEADFTGEYEAVIGQYRRQAGVLIPRIDYAAEGIVEKIETFTVTTTPDNTTFAGTDTHEVNVVTYYAQDLDVAEGNVPLVLCFHGGGNTALYEAMATEWPLIGKENGFITVSVDLHYPNVTAAETIELIALLEEEYSIDASRIYASGFSMGGVKSWDLYEQYPEVFAGLAPMDAAEAPGTDSFGNSVENINTETIVPVFYVAGETSPLPEMPCQAEKLVERIGYLFDVNQVAKAYDVSFEEQESWENQFWGVNGDESYEVPDENYFTDSVLMVEVFESTDGNSYTALAVSGNQSHEVYGRNSWVAWNFLSQFSRGEDGSVVIDAQ